MASIISNTISRVTTGQSAADNDDSSSEKYVLKVTAGTSYENSTKKSVVVNGETCTVADNCKVAVRIHEYRGVPGESRSHSEYFEDAARAKDTYSIAFSWASKEDVSAEDLVWGIELVRQIAMLYNT